MRFAKILFIGLATLAALSSVGCENKEKIRMKKIEKGIDLISLDVDKLATDAFKMKIQSGIISPDEAKTELMTLYKDAAKKMEDNVEKCKGAINNEWNKGPGMGVYVDGQLVMTGKDDNKIAQYQQQMQQFGNAAAHYGQVATKIGAFNTSLN
ncbi:MAG: hypothetical protein NTW40_01405 [Acidobacteria bacterium]|nr:hypothetical protein [Acidobacteriota bacterium]